MAAQLDLQALKRASLVGADGRGFSPSSSGPLAGLQIRGWGYDQALDERFARGVEATRNPNQLTHNATPLPSEWDAMGHVVSGRRNAIEAAGGDARIANPLLTRRARVPVGATRSFTADQEVEMSPNAAPASYGSGAMAALERKRLELGLEETDNALARARIAGQDLDGSQRRSVERGRAIADDLHELENVAPQRQRLTNSVNALARAANRDEYGKDFEAQRPAREYQDRQFQQRYVEPADIRARAAVESARLGGTAKENVAETNATGRVDAARLAALARQVQELIKGGNVEAATVRGDQIEPVDEVGQAIQRLREEHPDASAEDIMYMLGDDLTPEERATATRLLGGA